jgi:hypothetical protein
MELSKVDELFFGNQRCQVSAELDEFRGRSGSAFFLGRPAKRSKMGGH